MTGAAVVPRQTNWRLLLTLLCVALGAMRIMGTWTVLSETYDEPAHLAVGIELLDRGTFTYEAQHPPLARLAAGLAPFLAGSRSHGQPDMWNEGRAILYDGNAVRTLYLARLGILPFFLLACAALWAWTNRLAGASEASVAVALFTLAPPVLAHAGVATTDMALTAGWLLFFGVLTAWLDRPAPWRSVALGLATTLALTTKLSSIPFLGAAVPIVLVARWWLSRSTGAPVRLLPPLRGVGIVVGVTLIGIWATYGFPLTIRQGLPLPLSLMWEGVQAAAEHNRKGHAAFLLGRAYHQGDWRFFPVALGVKTPLTLLALGVGGAFLVATRARVARDWRLWVPLIAAGAVLAVSIPARINIGVRHVLPIFGVLALCGGVAALQVWRKTTGNTIVRAVFLALVGAGLWSTARVHPDYLAYFNEVAGPHPERVLVDSDLDWGQDLRRLSDTLRTRGISSVTTAYFGSAEPAAYGVPVTAGWRRGATVQGWFAVSQTLRSRGPARFVNGQWDIDQNALAWLDNHQPVARIGRSILLYDIR